MNTAEYFDTNYKKYQCANIVKSQESSQPNRNSIFKRAAKIKEEISQPNEKSDAKDDVIQHIKAKNTSNVKVTDAYKLLLPT